MTLVVPVVLGGLALAVMAFVSIAASRRQRSGASETPEYLPTILVHAINDDRCTGCDACVAVCPTNVLDLVNNKSRVLRFQDCIQCEACMWACPTEALVMHKEGTEPPPLTVPELDEFYQTAVPGQYLIGEVAGKPLVKNAANLGRAVVEHMLATGLAPSRSQETVDVAIVGSGPGGLSAALTCVERGLSYVLLEKEQILASTVSRYPKGKLVMAEPYDTRNLSLLPVFDSTKEELVPIWSEIVERIGLRINKGEAVESVVRSESGLFQVTTTVGLYQAQRVVLATGTRGKPRTLGVPGENLAKVSSLLDDPDEHRGRAVLIVGGGDSALEATLALADAGAKVILSYRGRSFNRAQPKLRAMVEDYDRQRRIKIKYQSVVTEIDATTVTLTMGDGSQKKYPNEAAFVLIGSEPPVKWLQKLGVRFVQRPHAYALPHSDALVERLAGGRAKECPESAGEAVALIRGRELPRTPAPERIRRREGTGSKWLRAATGLLGMNTGRDRRRHSGSGRRDQLPPSERTRVLRMLRDEGARIADEESYQGPIPDPFSDGGRASRATSPPRLEETAPKQAVIVGLAQAAARGPRGGRKRRHSGAPPAATSRNEGQKSPPLGPPAQDASTRRIDTNELLDNLIKQDRAKKRSTAPPPADEFFAEDPTRIVGLDAKRFMEEAEQGGHAQLRPDEPTAMVDFQHLGGGRPPKQPAGARHGDEPEHGLPGVPSPRVFSDSVELEDPGARGPGRKRPGSDVHEDPTRQIELGPLGDVEFDLD